MHKKHRAALEQWAIAYAENKSLLPRSPYQALAIRIHEYMMSHGDWRTSTMIAKEIKESIHDVRRVLLCIRDHWGYESSKRKGYKKCQLN